MKGLCFNVENLPSCALVPLLSLRTLKEPNASTVSDKIELCISSYASEQKETFTIKSCSLLPAIFPGIILLNS
jgi:hypothetical protein